MVKMKLYNYSAIHETLPFLWAQPVKQIDEGVFSVQRSLQVNVLYEGLLGLGIINHRRCEAKYLPGRKQTSRFPF